MFGRIGYAWGVLRHGIPGPEIVYLVGGIEEVTLYAVRVSSWPSISWRYYTTCAEAHATNPGAPVESVKAFKSGGNYYCNHYLYGIELEPKQRIPVESLGRES